MKNNNSNSIPHRYHHHPINPWKCPTEDGGEFHYMGLTKLEYFTGIALKTVLMNEGRFWEDDSDEKIVESAIKLAKEVLKQLENK